MEFLCHHRDRPGSAPLRHELREEHWSYMDRYAKELIARGPTLADDLEAATGSVHIVDLPDPAAARAFAFDEPTYQAGVYRDVLLRRWRNALGRTMWDVPGGLVDGNRYLVLGLGSGQAADLAVPADSGELIAYGPLLSDDGETWLGTAALLRAPDPETARAILTPDRYADIEVHNWQPGGRSSRRGHHNRTCRPRATGGRGSGAGAGGRGGAGVPAGQRAHARAACHPRSGAAVPVWVAWRL
jgi:uncharacterized protein YciI